MTLYSLIFTFSFFAASQQAPDISSFKQCQATDNPRSELDTFCPRVEGVHPEGCCPQLFKQPPLQCYYSIVVNRGQAYLANSSYTTCQGGENVRVSCCVVRQRTCYRDLKQLPFLPRLLHRNNSCCFENCPPADYWRAAPANPAISSQHELTGNGVPICTGSVLDECSHGSSANCQASSPCPVEPKPSNEPSDGGNPDPPKPDPKPQDPPKPDPPKPDPPQDPPIITPGGA